MPKPKPNPDALKAAEARLKAAKDKALRAKLGPPLALSDPALEQAAVVQPLDIEAALAFWRKNAPPGFKDLLDAKATEL